VTSSVKFGETLYEKVPAVVIDGVIFLLKFFVVNSDKLILGNCFSIIGSFDELDDCDKEDDNS